jgi:hypothetical protein
MVSAGRSSGRGPTRHGRACVLGVGIARSGLRRLLLPAHRRFAALAPAVGPGGMGRHHFDMAKACHTWVLSGLAMLAATGEFLLGRSLFRGGSPGMDLGVVCLSPRVLEVAASLGFRCAGLED